VTHSKTNGALMSVKKKFRGLGLINLGNGSISL